MFQNRPIILNINKCHFVKGWINIKHLPGIIIGVVDYFMKMTMLRYFEYGGVMTWWWQHICLNIVVWWLDDGNIFVLSVYYYQGLVFIKIQYEDMNMVLQQLSVRPDQSVIKWSYDKILSITCMLWCSLSNVVFSKEEMVRRWLYTFVRVGECLSFYLVWYSDIRQ